jgi:tetratricopeptide (TPR) repeat protein
MTSAGAPIERSLPGLAARAGSPATGGGTDSSRPPVASRRVSATFVAWLVCAAVVGASVGRLVFFTPSPSATTDAVPAITSETSSSASIRVLEQRVQDAPTDVRALQALGNTYVRRAAEVADPAFYDLAQGAFDRADAVRPELDETRLGRALLALSRHDFAQALALGSTVHTNNPDNPDALAVMVDANVELGLYEDARATLQELLDRHPGLPAYARLSYVRELEGDTTSALRAMRQADTAANGIAFDRATVATFIGDLELARGRVRAASRQYDRALTLAPDLALARIGAARVAAVQGDTRGAISDLRALTRKLPVPAAVALLGDLQARAGDAGAAARSFELVRTIGTLQQASGQVTDLETALFEADHARNAGLAARAVELAYSAHAARPDNVFVNDAVAWALYRSGDVMGALPYVERALRLGTPDTLLHYHAAVIFDAAGSRDRARGEIATVIGGNPAFSFRYDDDARALARRLGVRT